MSVRLLGLLAATSLWISLAAVAQAKGVLLEGLYAPSALGVSDNQSDPLDDGFSNTQAFPTVRVKNAPLNLLANPDFVASHTNTFASPDNFQGLGQTTQSFDVGQAPADDIDLSLGADDAMDASSASEPSVWILLFGAFAIAGGLLRVSKELLAERRSGRTNRRLPVHLS